jgi:copper chaperone
MTKTKIAGLLILVLLTTFGSALATHSTTTTIIKVEGMHCEGCASSVEKKLKATEGVEEVRIDLPKKEAWVKYDDQKVTVAKLREVINSTGFKAVE